MRWLTSADDSGERLDRYLAEHYGEARNQTARWIRDGRVLVADRTATKPSQRLDGGEWIECAPPVRDAAGAMAPEAAPLDLLFADEHVAIVDKPAGLVVHPGAGRPSGTLAHRLLHHFPETAAVGGPGRPGIVHRLDRETSGCLIVARTPEAYAALSALFAERRIAKTYLALAYGEPSPSSGIVDAPIARHRTRRKEMTVNAGGRPALTRYRTLGAARGVALLEIDLETGRTHQIRVHLKHLRHPLVGDPVYGEARWKELPRALQPTLRGFGRPALHAWRLSLDHPITAAPLAAEAPPPEDLIELWTALSDRSLEALLPAADP